MLTGKHSEASCQLNVTPQTALVDEPVTICVSNLSPNQPVLLRAQTRDDANQLWESQALFIANPNGEIDVSQQPAQSGSYQGVDPMGLFWFLSVPGDTQAKISFVKTTSRPLIVTVQAETAGSVLSSVSVERTFAASDVARIPLQEHGLAATLFSPPGPGPYPAVIVLSGSDGGMHEEAAALLASHGYASLALAYIQGPNAAQGIPRYLVNIPLEYFERAIKWLQEQNYIDEHKVIVLGHSRGGELALLLGTVFPQIRAVIADSPASTMNCGITTRAVDKPSWLYRNLPFPYLKLSFTIPDIINLIWKQITRTPFALKPFFMKALRQQDEVRKATIPVEKIQGPILLISGQDDQAWPSDIFAEQVIERLKQHHHPHYYKHLTYEDAGHLMCAPYGHPFLPPMLRFSVGSLLCDGGGKPQKQAQATVHSWHQILAFLQRVKES